MIAVAPLVVRVTITLCKIGKHQLPVKDDCAYAHSVGFNLNPEVCPDVGEGGSPAANVRGIQQCMDEAQCRLVDDRLQMVIFRDPRPAAVSSFYYLSANNYIPADMDVDAFILQNFRGFCKWLLVRMVLFKRLTPKDRYFCFWYNEWKTDPAVWHRQLFRMLGLTVPDSVLVAATDAALADDFPFFTKGRDVHGGGTAPPPPDHTYRDDVTNSTAQRMDEMMREWIPRRFAARLHADF